MTTTTRLAKVRQALSPRELVLAWLDDVHRQFDSFGKWMEWAAHAPGESPYYKLPEAAMVAVRTARKGRREDSERAQEDAALSTIFLVSLSMQCSEELGDALTKCAMSAALCARSLQVLLLRSLLDGTAAPASPDGAEEAGQRPHMLRGQDTAAVRSSIVELLESVYLHRAVIRAIECNYFAGRGMLFRATAGRLAETITLAERLTDEFNDFLRDRGDPADGQDAPTPPAGETAGRGDGGVIDLAEVRASARAKVRADVIFAVARAKAEALVAMDRREQAADLTLKAWKDRVAFDQRQGLDRR